MEKRKRQVFNNMMSRLLNFSFVINKNESQLPLIWLALKSQDFAFSIVLRKAGSQPMSFIVGTWQLELTIPTYVHIHASIG